MNVRNHPVRFLLDATIKANVFDSLATTGSDNYFNSFNY